MNPVTKFQKEFSRELYKIARRQTGCPPVNATETPWGYFVETKDGSYRQDQVKAQDIWDAKRQGVKGWTEKHKQTEIKLS